MVSSTGRSLFSTDGVVIRRPMARATRAPDPQTTYLCYPSGDGATEWSNADDAETLAVFQELAFRYAMDQTHSTVRAVLLRANKKCYSDAHAFLQRYMQRAATKGDPARSAVPRVVMFPKLMKFPAVAIVSGSDATFSDVWMTPLCQVIHRSFPAILMVREKVNNVRSMVEWMLERLDDYTAMKKREETWLGHQMDAWYEFSERRTGDQYPGAAPAFATEELPRLRPRRARTSLDGVAAGHDDSDKDYSFSDSDESTSGSDDDGGDGGIDDKEEHVASRKKVGAKRKRRGRTKRHMKYNDLLLDDLLQTLSDRMEILQRASDVTLSWTATLRDVIQEDLRKQLERCDGDLERSIQCHYETFEWIKSRILAYRELRCVPSSIRASTAEFTLATLAYRMLTQFLSFITASSSQSTAEAELVAKWTREIQRQIECLEDTNHLHQFDVSQYEQVSCQLDPYLLICIEQLDQVNLQALRDFVDLWSRFEDRDDGDKGDHSTRVGFILGVTTTTSQTLRQLGLSVMRRLDMQFFALDDSKTRSEDILDALLVQNNFPLCLSGDALRLLDDRHLTSQSLAAFTQVLEFFALSHFQDTPWSFLSRFVFDVHRQAPLFHDLPQHSTLRKWIVRSDFRGRSLRDVLSCFSDDCVNTLLSKFRDPKASEDRFGPLDQELRRFSNQRANWIVGWRCLQLTFAWLKLEKRCEEYVECLAMALDGRVADLSKVEWCVIKIKVEPLPKLIGMMEDWSAAAATSCDASLQREVGDLIMLAAHIVDTATDPETARMRPLFRDEVSEFFRKRILGLMEFEQPTLGSGRGMVCDWVFAVKNPSVKRAHVTVNLHEDIVESLTQLDDDAYQQSTAVGDLSLVFLYYREHSTLQLNVADWFAAFADAVREELASNADEAINVAELNARFARALATLRLWGYINGPDGVRRAGRRHRDARVHKRIFM